MNSRTSYMADKATKPQGPRVRRVKVVDEIIETMRQDIVTRRLRHGERLPSEKELSERFGVSQPHDQGKPSSRAGNAWPRRGAARKRLLRPWPGRLRAGICPSNASPVEKRGDYGRPGCATGAGKSFHRAGGKAGNRARDVDSIARAASRVRRAQPLKDNRRDYHLHP